MANKLIHIFLELVGEQIMNNTYFVHLKFWIKLYATGKNYGMGDCIIKYEVICPLLENKIHVGVNQVRTLSFLL